MIEDEALAQLTIGTLCESLAHLLREPFGRGKYRSMVYSALLSANQLGYNTGVALALTTAGASVVDAVIALPTGIARFRLAWFIGSLGTDHNEANKAAIDSYLAMSAPGVLPLMRYPHTCCTRCHVWETREGTYCHNTRCSCHKRR